MSDPRVPSIDPVASPERHSLDVSRLQHEGRIEETPSTVVHRVTVPTRGTPDTVAVKHPARHATFGPDVPRSFQREASRWEAVDDHRHVTAVVDWGEDSLPWLVPDAALPWIAMEYMDGGDLTDYVGTTDVAEGLWIAERLAEALWYVHHHGAGMPHLDLKPANILFRETDDGLWNVPKIADWELVDGGIGTPRYTSPEQVAGDGTDQRTDQFQLGTVLYELFTGQYPFLDAPENAAEKEFTTAISEQEPPRATTHRARLPDALDDVLHTMLAKSPADRYEAMYEVRNAFAEIREQWAKDGSAGRSRATDDQRGGGEAGSGGAEPEQRTPDVDFDGTAGTDANGGVDEMTDRLNADIDGFVEQIVDEAITDADVTETHTSRNVTISTSGSDTVDVDVQSISWSGTVVDRAEFVSKVTQGNPAAMVPRGTDVIVADVYGDFDHDNGVLVPDGITVDGELTSTDDVTVIGRVGGLVRGGGSVTVKGGGGVSGPVAARQQVTVKSDSHVEGQVYAEGDATVKSNARVDGSIDAKGDATVKSNAAVGGTIDARGDVTAKSNAVVSGAIDTDGAVTIKSNATVEGDVDAAGDVTAKSQVVVGGGVTTAAGVELKSNARVRGDVRARQAALKQCVITGDLTASDIDRSAATRIAGEIRTL